MTRFFRDPEVFDTLKREVIPSLLRGCTSENPLRAWVAGCATGEEAYSLAIAIRECWEEQRGEDPLDVQIYATDLDQAAIERARRGVFSRAITGDVSPERLARFFVQDGDGYRVKSTIRDMVVFATQNLVFDPPFTKLDILSCRNVLIYLEPELQRKLLPLFLYALKATGILVLGGSEGVNGFEDGFRAVHGDLKIFDCNGSTPRFVRSAVDFPAGRRHRRVSTATARGAPPTVERELEELVRSTVIDRIAPPVIAVDKNGELLYASRPTGRYFELPPGRVSTNVFAMAREGVALPLRTGLRKALARGTTVTQRGVRVRVNEHDVFVDVSVMPLREGRFAGTAVISFNETPKVRAAPRGKKGSVPKSTSHDRAALLRLRDTKAQLDALMAEMRLSEQALKTVNEEVQRANEQLQSTNEELQSANEELTTSKEEMQSMNEELLTLNADLQTTNEQLATTNDDMRNLLNSSQIPTLFLDNDLRLKRYSAEATRIARLIASDVGRPITDLAWSVRYVTLARDVKSVLDTQMSFETEVVADDGATYTMRVHPYRTIDDIVDGVVITFMDITAQKRDAATTRLEERSQLLTRAIGRWPGVAWVEEVRSRRSLVVSAASERLLGVAQKTLDDATGDFWQELGRPEYRERTVVLASDDQGEATHVLHFLRRRAQAAGVGS